MRLHVPEPLLGFWLRLTLRSVFGPPVPIRAQRVWMDLQRRITLPERSVRTEETVLGGVRTVRFVPPVRTPGAPVVLYSHGGAFIMGAPESHASLTAHLALLTGGDVYSVDYRLAPEHPYPAGRQDLRAAWDDLSARLGPERIVVGGDSAGGVMVMDLLLELRGDGEKQPAGAVLLSPMVGLNRERAHGTGLRDTVLRRGWLVTGVEALARPDDEVILGTDLTGLAPIHLQYSRGELFEAECAELVDELTRAGSPPDVRFDQLYWGWHVLALLPGFSRQAREAVGRFAAFATRVVPDPALRRGAEEGPGAG